MGYANDVIAALLVQFIDLLLCAFYRVQELHPTAFVQVYQSVHLGAYAEDANLKSLTVDNSVLDDGALHGSAGEVVVAADDREV